MLHTYRAQIKQYKTTNTKNNIDFDRAGENFRLITNINMRVRTYLCDIFFVHNVRYVHALMREFCHHGNYVVKDVKEI